MINFYPYIAPGALVYMFCLFPYWHRVYTVRESQGEKGLFCFGQGKSGKVREACSGQGHNSIFILFHHQGGMYNT